MACDEVAIRTGDGSCRTFVFTPAATGKWPAVIFYMDALAIRPVLFDMCERLARAGYVVLLPDLFYRAGPYQPLDPKAVFAGEAGRAALAPLRKSTDIQRATQDTAAILAYIDSRADVLGSAIGVTGYCMGGGIALTVAGTYPERIAAAASFHGGNLATGSESSPHLLAPKMKARVYVAGADNDNSYPPEMAARLEQALRDAGVPHRCEIYQGALHGWTMADFPIYNEQATERHWHELIALFDATLH